MGSRAQDIRTWYKCLGTKKAMRAVIKGMQCPRCGSISGQPSAFCANCGLPLALGASPSGSAAAPPIPVARSKSQKGLWIGASLLLAIVLGIYGLSSSGLLKVPWAEKSRNSLNQSAAMYGSDNLSVKNSEGADILSMNGEQPAANTLEVKGDQSVRTLDVPNSEPANTLDLNREQISMPDDVRKWLEHLERIERKRSDLSREQLASAMAMLTALQAGGTLEQLQGLLEEANGGEPTRKESPAKRTMSDIDSMRGLWRDLNSEFLSLPPPDECVPIRDTYDTVVRETGTMIVEIVQSIERAEEDQQGALRTLMGMQGSSKKRVGEPSSRTDRQVGEVCRKYQTMKWFSISDDFGGGLLSKLGF